MDGIGAQMRRRARELGLADAEVARRAGLSERRYGNYVTEAREPDLGTLLRICEALGVTPNELLLEENRLTSQRHRLAARLAATANQLAIDDLKVAVCQAECLLNLRSNPKRTGQRSTIASSKRS